MVGVSTHRDVDIYPVGEGAIKIILDVGMWGIELQIHFQHEKLRIRAPSYLLCFLQGFCVYSMGVVGEYLLVLTNLESVPLVSAR